MKTITFDTVGTCSKQILITIDDNGIVQEVKFIGGCAGNTTGISALVRGMKAEEVISRLQGTLCGSKGTSCPDQLARALKQAL